MQSDPSPSNTITRRSGHPSASPSPSVDAPPMNPTHAIDRSSGAIVRQAGAVVMVGMQMAVPRLAAMILSTSSGFIGSVMRSLLARGEPDEHGGGTATLTAFLVVLGNARDVVRALEPRVRHTEQIEQRLGIAHHRVPGLPWVLVALAAQQPDHVEDRHASVDRDAAERVDRCVEPG